MGSKTIVDVRKTLDIFNIKSKVKLYYERNNKSITINDILDWQDEKYPTLIKGSNIRQEIIS